MKPRPKSSPAAQALIKRFETFYANAVQEPDGRWVVGYGHRAAAKSGVSVSEAEASLLLIYDVMQAEKAIDDVATETLTNHQRDALISFVHGVGAPAFRSSDVARYLYEGRAQATAEAIAAHGDIDFDRRDAESVLFLRDPKRAAPVRAAEPDDALVDLVIKVEHPSEPSEEADENVEVRPAELEGTETIDLKSIRSDLTQTEQPGEPPAQLPDPVVALVKRVEADTAPASAPTVSPTPPADLPGMMESVEAAFEGSSTLEPAEVEEPSTPLEDAPVAPEELPAQSIAEADEEPLAPPPMPLIPNGQREAEDEISRILEAADSNGKTVDEASENAEAVVETEANAEPDAPELEPESATEPVRDDTPVKTDPEPEKVPVKPPVRRRLVTGSPLDGLLSGAPKKIPAPVIRPDEEKVEANPSASADTTASQADPNAPEQDPVVEASAPLNTPTEAVNQAPLTPSTQDVAAETDPTSQLIARMAIQITGFEPVVEAPEAGMAVDVATEKHLPEGVSVGYVLAGGMLAHLDSGRTDTNADTDNAHETSVEPIDAVGSDDLADVKADSEKTEANTSPSFGEELAELAAAMRDGETVQPVEADEPQAGPVVTEIEAPAVNQADPDGSSAIAAQDTHPPHPSEKPAPSQGAVGDVTGAKSSVKDDPVGLDEAFAAVTDDRGSEFAPHDLVGEAEPFVDADVEMQEYQDNGFGFMAVILAGLVLTIGGGYNVYQNIDVLLEEQNMNAGVAALVGGVFLFVAASIQLFGVLRKKQRRKSKS
jgi:lysozyme